MRLLVEKNLGEHRINLKISILNYPYREMVISVNGGTLMPEEAIELNDLIASVINFVQNDPDPWNNDYAL